MRKVAAAAERIAQILAVLGAFVFLTSGVVYLYQGRWTVTKADYWALYDFYLNHSWFESALRKHYGESLLFPSFVWMADLQFFHGRQLPIFLTGLALLFLSTALILIPVWRDKTVGLTAKLIATFVVIAGSFWMARSPITASGGFNVICSLVVVGALIAILALPKMAVDSKLMWPATAVVIAGAFVSSFSFGAGLATWPTLLLLLWSLRFHWRCFVTIGIAGILAVVIYQHLPPRSEEYWSIQALSSTGLDLVSRLCRLTGGPFFYGTSVWHSKLPTAEGAGTSMLAFWCGALGLAIAAVAVVLTLIRRDLAKSSLKFIGMAVLVFTLIDMFLAVIANCLRGRGFELQFVAPRYLFWSALFWAALLLVVIQSAESRQWLRWPVYLLAIALPILALPYHHLVALHTKGAKALDQWAAVSLVVGVRDERQIGVLFKHTKQIYHLAEQLRARRLDMFADGVQDWIGMTEASLFGGRHKEEKLSGQCAVAAVVKSDNGAPAARITGRALKKPQRSRIMRWILTPASWLFGKEVKKGYITPETLVVVDSVGVIRGIACASPTSPFISRAFYLGRDQPILFAGYIRDYNPQLQYRLRSADDGILSEESIRVQSRNR
jgi:hypothetical protein